MNTLGRVSLLAALVTAAGCGRPGGTSQSLQTLPDIVLVSIDTLRADHLGSYGYFRNTSPEVDAIASEAILFERCLATMATTLPSHMSLFTATYPIEHGILANVKHGGRRFSRASGMRSFADVARALGYDTAAFVSATPVKSDTGIGAGFQTFDEPDGARRSGEATMNLALAWLERRPDSPFLLWVHLFDPHSPYTAPASDRYASDDGLAASTRERAIPQRCRAHDGREFVAADAINAYDGAVRAADRQVGRLRRRLEELGLWQLSVFVVIGDHGEGLCQHDQPFHGDVYDEQLHVPLVVRVPGQPPSRVARQLSITDVLPTVLALIGSEPWGDFLVQASGRNALESALPAPPVFSQRTQRLREDLEGPAFALTSDEWKLILEPGGASRLYQRERDRSELHDLASERPAVVVDLRREMLARIAAQRANAVRFRGTEADDAELGAERIEELRSLGYIE